MTLSEIIILVIYLDLIIQFVRSHSVIAAIWLHPAARTESLIFHGHQPAKSIDYI
jgi:hypothetical protein